MQGLISKIFVEFQGNLVQEGLYENYSIGFASLRYILVISFGLAIYRIQELKEYTLLNFFNILIFICYTLIFGRRLQIIAAFFVFICLANRDRNFVYRLKNKSLYLISFFVIALIVGATTVRNFNTYLDIGTTNPFLATFSDVISYLGSPFQVSLEIGNNMHLAIHKIPYTSFTSVYESLTTNSALSTVIYEWGMFAYMYIIVIALFYSFIAGSLYKYRNSSFYVAFPIIIYAFSELWRINLFNQGIFVTLLVTSLMVPTFKLFSNTAPYE